MKLPIFCKNNNKFRFKFVKVREVSHNIKCDVNVVIAKRI